MKLTTLASIAASLSYAGAAEESHGAPKVIQHTISRRQNVNPLARDRRRFLKRSTVSATLYNEETLYLMRVNIGTPAQAVTLHLDTGSSDLWVNVPGSALCTSRDAPCDGTGTYNANSSSTYRYVNSLFNISYVDGSGSAGDYVTDTVAFGGASLSDQQIGVGYESSSPEGIIGIGYPINEAIVAYTNGKTYTNVPQNLVQKGLINTNAYSLWLNDLDASQGQILFGGVNTAKFRAPLVTVPVVREYGLYSEFVIALTGLGHNGNAGSLASNQAIGVLLDSGSSLTYLPDDLTQSVYDTLGVTYNSQQGFAPVSCSRGRTQNDTIDFTFSSITIRVDMSELVVVAGYSQGREVCIIGIVPSEDSQPVLGDTFLRSAYVVYDLQNNQIALAQTNFNSSSNNVVEITSGTAIPSATAASNPVSTVSAQQTGGHVNGGGRITITSTYGSAATPTAALGYGAAMVGVVGAGLLAVV